MIFLNNDPFELAVFKIITCIRTHIPRGLEEGTLRFFVSCANCKSLGQESEYRVRLPSHTDIMKSISSNQLLIQTKCPRCSWYNDVDVRTLKTVRTRPGGPFDEFFTV